MLSNSFRLLLKRAPISASRVIAAIIGCLIALATPVLALTIGHVVQALSGQPHAAIVRGLPPFGWNLNEASTLARVSWMLILAIAIALAASCLLFWLYKLVQLAAVQFETELFETIRHHVQRLAQYRTLTAQQSVLQDSLEYHLPRVRSVLARYLHAFPRHLVQLALCLLIAVAIHYRFAIVSCIAAALVFLFYQLVDRSRRKQLPVVRENATRLRSRVLRVSLRGPLLQAVHDSHEIDRRFHHLLELYQRDAVRSLTSSAWKTPLVLVSLSSLALLMIFLVSVQWIRGELQIAPMVVFSICMAGAVFSARRLWQVLREIKQVDSAAMDLTRYLSATVPDSETAHLMDLNNVVNRLELEHVTVQDTLGRKLLEDMCLVLEPGKLIGIVATQGMESRTLAELLIGLGQPTSGRMLVDGRLAADFKPDALTRCSHWVASDGGILTGSLAENLAPSDANAMESALHRAELNGFLNRLTEGIHTVVTHDDDRMVSDEPFRLGIARALIRNSPICLIEEPESAVEMETEQLTLNAIRQLVSPSRFLIVLPQRITTLRQCDRVYFVHEHHLVDSGTHAELIQRNELYRHLTYIRFNQFRQ